jgi:T-complex protein 1 subunit alpha
LLQNFACTLGSREQLAIAEFAEALLVSTDAQRPSCFSAVGSEWSAGQVLLPVQCLLLHLAIFLHQVIPKTLAVNAACDATDLVAKLRAHHNAAQVHPSVHETHLFARLGRHWAQYCKSRGASPIILLGVA